MRIHSICLVKNEQDIIAQSLIAAAEWSDFIYVYDGGSTDGTWETVQELSTKLPQVVPFRSEDLPFHDGLRKLPFSQYRRRASPGDWWGRLDADEFYIDSPREFLARVPPSYDTVWSASFQYFLTEKDLARFAADPAQYADSVPVEQKCRYYVNNWGEIRFFKYSPHLRWWGTNGQPYPLMRAYNERIRLKHYQYRSPQQIEKRLTTRQAAIHAGKFLHEAHGAWTDRIVDSSKLILDNGSDYVITEHLMPRIPDSSGSLVKRVKRTVFRAVAGLLPQ